MSTRTERRHTDDPSALLMLTAVTAGCRDCGDERIFLPIEDSGPEFCCTSCDAAVFLAFAADPVLAGSGPLTQGGRATDVA